MFVCVNVQYQWIFEVHESPVVQSEPAFLEAFPLLQRQRSRQKLSDMVLTVDSRDTKQHCTTTGGVCLFH